MNPEEKGRGGEERQGRDAATTHNLPRLSTGLDDWVNVGRVRSDMVEPRVPDRLNLGSIEIVLLVVYPSMTAWNFVEILVELVAQPGVAGKGKLVSTQSTRATHVGYTHESTPTSLPALASPMYCRSRQNFRRPDVRMCRMVLASDMVAKMSNHVAPPFRNQWGARLHVRLLRPHI